MLSCLNTRACFEIEATLAESLGTYRGAVPGGDAKLIVNGDGSWDYRIEDRQGQAKFQRAGRWKYERNIDHGRITFDNFEFGFRRHDDEPDPPKPIYWIPLITNRGGAIQICFFPGKLDCFRKGRAFYAPGCWRPTVEVPTDKTMQNHPDDTTDPCSWG